MSSRWPTRRLVMNRAEWFVALVVSLAALAFFCVYVAPFAWMVLRLFFVTLFNPA